MKNIFLILFLFIINFNLKAQDSSEYQGYRLYVSNVEVIQIAKSNFKIKTFVTNTGSKDLTNADFQDYKEVLVVKMDEQLFETKIFPYEDLIIQKIKNTKWDLASGKSEKTDFKINIPKERRGETDNIVGGKSVSGSYNRDLCTDLVMDTVILVKKDKKNAYVKAQISNIGKGAINIIGDKKNVQDNINVGAYFSGTPKFSKGAILAGEVYITGLDDTDGILFPGDKIEIEMKVKRKAQSKYTKVLILIVDAKQVVIECNETNNNNSVLVK